jgi:GNAT superfamily N-acetyltransferase
MQQLQNGFWKRYDCEHVSILKTKFVVREAKESDKDAVLRFSRNAFEHGDYIADVWDSWSTDPEGKIFVATFEDIPIGMLHVEILKKGEAWLEGARVAAEFRRRGVASSLNSACFEWAIKRGARVARLVTNSTNLTAQKALAKMEFERVSDWTRMQFEGCQLDISKDARLAEESDIGMIWRFLKSSEDFTASSGLFVIMFRWMSLDRAELRRFIGRSMAIIHERKKGVDGLILFDDTIRRAWQRNSVQTCYVGGNPRAILSMSRFLKGHLYNLGVASIYGAMCNRRHLTSAFAKVGFRTNPRSHLVYEKRLG